MNLLKSMFISSYMMLLIGVTGFAGWMLYRSEHPAAWIGVMLTTAPLLVVVTWLMMIKNVARTSAHFPFVNWLGAIGAGLALWSWYGQGTSITAPILAVGAWICFVLYAYWFSTFGGRQPSAKLQVGAVLPHFMLKHASGESVTTAQLTGKPTILMFYRGNWCPLCMAQIKELAARYRDLTALGVRVALISPQPHDNTVELAKKYQVNFDFLTDTGNAAARTLGIENPNGTPMGMQMFGYDNDTVLPTVIVTDRNGQVVWTHETDNYRIRPEPDVYLDVLRRHQLVPVLA
ncbi:peroxiredoxin family protein [Methylocaldum sp.]|uniref:peroxiredoxin family protein n=1 Tax=Methylocaldum sp. TaxID=1969727 RepID=UPI002D4F1CFF|nr:peroxiredoxin family protein [Methylocaldum sp.]HYE35601.1 peroxiredoxin family protein [Methylocaldum sp.]